MSKPAEKRSRACDACHSIKIKCELGSSGGAPPCERCVRLNKSCTISTPKRQKDRVAELEAEVESLRRMLTAQSLGSISPTDNDSKALSQKKTKSIEPAINWKKRRLSSSSFSPSADVETEQQHVFRLGHIVSEELQERLFAKYRDKFVPVFPFVPIPRTWSLETLRSLRPFMLEAIIYAVCHGEVPRDLEEDIAKVFMSDAARSTIALGGKSLELVQAIHIACLWYCTPEHHKSMAAFQLLQLSHGIAIDIGIGGPQSTPWMGPPVDETEQTEPADGWRAWLTCHMLSAIVTILLRRPKTQQWTQHHNDSLFMLDYSTTNLETDRLLCQYVRAERLCEQIVDEMALFELSTVYDVTADGVQSKMQSLTGMILNWRMQIPAHLRLPSVLLYEHLAVIYVNETVLHTATNKASFAAPFVAERLSVTDFPTPTVTLHHIVSINAIVASSHAVLDLVADMDIGTIVLLPGLIFASRVAYAGFILLQVYITATAFGNTFGAAITPEDLRVEFYLRKMVEVSTKVKEADGRSSVSRIFSAWIRMEEWYNNYTTMLSSTLLIQEPGSQISNLQFPAPSHSYDGWDDFMRMPDGQDLDLSDLFATVEPGDAAFESLVT